MFKVTDPCDEIAAALAQAGWPEWAIPIMVRVAYAESGCRREATARSPLEYSVGPFQINLLAHPGVSEECARDPFCAARYALQLARSPRGLCHWTAFRNLFPGQCLRVTDEPSETIATTTIAPTDILKPVKDLWDWLVGPARTAAIAGISLILIAWAVREAK